METFGCMRNQINFICELCANEQILQQNICTIEGLVVYLLHNKLNFTCLECISLLISHLAKAPGVFLPVTQ